MTPAAFLKEVKSEARKVLYLLTGGEPSALRRCLAAAEEAVEAGFRDFNFQVLDLEAGQAGHLTAEAATMPFFSPPRVLVAKNPPFSGEDWNLLADYLDDPNPSSTIVLTLDKLDARLKFARKIKAADMEVDCSPPKGAALSKWLADEFKARGVRAEPRVCGRIIERAGGDLGVLMGEAEKLSLYLGEGGLLSEELVRRLVSLAPNANVFELGEALGRRDLKSAVATLLDLLATEHHLPVLAMMVRHFRLMLSIKTRMSVLGVRRLGRDEAVNLGLHPFVLEKTQPQAAQWSWAELKNALKALEDAYRTLLTTAVPPRMVLENLALELGAAPKTAD
ncbi:MAG: DNA polymerase III subunit delta [Candidatus Adiutrix sp.]|jgi:DNA polymerase-3 subunit delta|nr:DNA polymerase III subunit delta [Candidatus Adiutrix sp.]